MAAGRVFVGHQACIKVSGQRLPVKDASLSITLLQLSLVCTCATLYCTQRGVSREFLVAAEQLRSLPEGFRLIRQPSRT